MSSFFSAFLPNDVRGSRTALQTGALWRRIGASLAGAALAVAAGTAAATPASPSAPVVANAIAAPAPASAPVTTSTGLVQMPDGRLLTPEFARIIGRGELVVAVLSVDQPPFFEERNGKLEGLDIDLARDMANKLHVKVRFNRDAHTFDDVVSLLARGQADIAVSKLSRTLTRATVIAFSSPYLRLNRALLLNRVKFAQLAHGRSVPEVVRSFDSTIGVVANSSYAGYVVNNFPHAQVRSYPTWDDVLKALNAGEVTAAYRDEFEVKRVLKVDPTASLRLRVVTLQDLEDTLAIGVNVNDPALLSFVNQFLAERSVKLDVSAVLQAADH
ncbi:substrate-binding periplasmic protein [Paraburkholderia atlantica]|uniref:substrate-binding periplasmic protein n=1 Tax=Paraburkholderia atlantica TaxID=2654982 RepID=UPI000377BC1C|nr:ABC transporter substrate-binding protein [Paraburkholderia atlantica]NUY32352.1 amino acid ABC transporter substrate-binding protein [Paraburkholderia atlantica]